MDAESIKEILEKARTTYGNRNQILVCIEELNELACVLAKYPRYEDEATARKELYSKVLDEVADVIIILDHVQSIIGVTDKSIRERIELKIERLNRWLKKSDKMQETIDDREINLSTCDSCTQEKSLCNTCRSSEATEGIKPFYKE